MSLHVASTSPVTRVLHIIFRQKWAILLFVGTVMAGVAAVTYTTPPSYQSEAKLFIKLGKESVLLDPTTSIGSAPIMASGGGRDQEISSIVEMVLAQPESVVEEVGIGPILGLKEEDVAHLNPAALDYYRRAAVGRLRGGTLVEAVKRSAVVRIVYEGPDPHVAQKVVDKLVTIYKREHVKMNGSSEAHAFLIKHATRMKAELKQAEEELQKERYRTGLISPESQRQIEVSRIGRLKDDLRTAETNLAASEAEVTALRTRANGLAPTQEMSRTTGVSSLPADGLRNELYKLQLEEKKLLLGTTSKPAEVRIIQEQLKTARELLDLEKKRPDREQVAIGPNRLREEMLSSLNRLEATVTSLRARKTALEEQLEEENEQLQTFIKDTLTVARLQRNVDLKEAGVKKFNDSLTQADFDKHRETELISNIAILQDPSFEPVPVRPRKRTNLNVGLVMALMGGLGLALLREFLDHSFRGSEDLESQLGLPALASIPSLNSRFLTLPRKN